jgi:hypothetical protein
MEFIKKYRHYILLVFFVVAQISFTAIYALRDIQLPDWLYALIQLGLAGSFVYAQANDAQEFQAKGEYGDVCRLMFGAGFICCALLSSALEHLFK